MLHQAEAVDRPHPVDVSSFDARVDGILGRRPSVGLAIGVIRDGELACFRGHGVADIASRTPITQDTVFRIGSVTKLVTAVAVMQLWEVGLVDLDAPAADVLRAFRLVSEDPRFGPVTIRHLLTHTSGIPELRGPSDLLHAAFTPSGGQSAMAAVPAGDPVPSLAEVYRDGLRVVVQPGTTFAYSNHGFATLGQIVEDVTEVPLDAYLHANVFGPLGMTDTDLVRTERVAASLATGYVLGRRGPRPAPDLEEAGGGHGGIYSTPRDMARFAAALLGQRAGGGAPILRSETLAAMIAPQFQPDRRIPGLGLAFFRGEVGGHRVVGHDGIMPGFNSALLLAPDDGVGLVAFTNGSGGAFAWLQIELHALLGDLLGVPDEPPRAIPQHPDAWSGLCGRYVLPPRISDLRGRLMLGGGAEVFVAGGRLMARILTPVPALLRGFPLRADDPDDPDVFVLETPDAGFPRIRVVFGRGGDGQATVAHADLGGQPWSLVRAPDVSRGGLAAPAVAALGMAAALAGSRRARRRGGAPR